MATIRVINADVLEGLRQLPDESVHCCVTSPPYWGLRDYSVEGQIGREATLDEHIDTIVRVFREVRRVLRADGTLWFNYGDAYCSSDKWGGGHSNKGKHTVDDRGVAASAAVRQKKNPTPGLKPKDLMMLPARMALALQADGWWVRKEIIWHKPNPMPESCQDRPTSSHEKVYLLTKSERYFYDAGAVRERGDWDATKTKFPDGWDTGTGGHGSHHRNGREKGRANAIGAKGNANGFRGGSYVNGQPGPRTSVGNSKPDKQRGHSRRHAGFNERWDAMSREEQQASRNLRDVWTIACEPFPDAHFATFPTRLAEICIKAGCPAGGTVLDPFGGSGTVGIVADRLERHAVLVELNPEYVGIAKRRLARDRLARRRGTMDDVESACLEPTPLEALIAGGTIT